MKCSLSSPPTTSVTQRHAETLVNTEFTDHPKHIVEIARTAILDGVANVLLARETPLGQMYLKSGQRVDQSCPIIGGTERSPVDAAFTNAGLWNALDWDDTVEGAGHPGASVIPAALAIGVIQGATVEEFLNAVVLGYELSIRSARALSPSWQRYDLVHGSGTRHTLGAAGAVAALCCDTPEEAATLLGAAAHLAPVPHAAKFGWDEQRLTWLKDNAARAASAAVRAGTLHTSESDFTGPRQTLDGDTGFWRMAGSDQCDWETLGEPLTEEYRLEELSFKPYPCCRWLHSAVEATTTATSEMASVESITISTTRRVATSFMLEPTNQVNAEFSLPFAVGQALDGRDPADWYGPDGPTTTTTVDLDVTVSDELTRAFEAERMAGATVTVAGDDTTVTETVSHPRGGSKRPLDATHHRRKLKRALAAHDSLDPTVDRLQAGLRGSESLASFANQLTNSNQTNEH